MNARSRDARSRIARSRISGRVSSVTGAGELDHVEARIVSLEEAVAENAALEVPLARLVADLERAVAGVVERSAGSGMRP